MAAISTIIAGIGLVGAGIGAYGAVKQAQGARTLAAQQQKAETIREAQTNVEATRNRRSMIRQAVLARAQAVNNATQQGAEGGSGLQGGQAQISSEANSAIVATNQNQDISSNMFATNRAIAGAQSTMATGSGISSLGQAIVKNSGEIGRVGSYLFNRG